MSTVKEHESYGTIVVSYVHGGDNNMCMSPVKHQNRIRLQIKRAQIYRTSSENFLHSKDSLIDVELTELQWGQMMSRFGKAEGTPCTIRRIGRESMADCPPDESFQLLKIEIEERAAEISKPLDRVYKLVAGLADFVGATGTIPKAELRNKVTEIASKLSGVISQIRSDIPFLTEQIQRQTDLFVEDAVSAVLGVFKHQVEYTRARDTAKAQLEADARTGAVIDVEQEETD